MVLSHTPKITSGHLGGRTRQSPHQLRPTHHIYAWYT